MEPWWDEVVELIAEKRLVEAVQKTRIAAESGSLAAQVRLARFGDDAGISRSEADRLVDVAEARVAAADATGHWVLYGAYEGGLGNCEYEERSRRALRHLEMFAAASGDAQAVFAVGINYLNGRLGVEPNVDMAVDWLHCAVALGHDGATKVLREIGGA